MKKVVILGGGNAGAPGAGGEGSPGGWVPSPTDTAGGFDGGQAVASGASGFYGGGGGGGASEVGGTAVTSPDLKGGEGAEGTLDYFKYGPTTPQALGGVAGGGDDEIDIDQIEVGEGESLEDIKAKLKPKKAAISAEMLDTANTYDDKVAVIRMIVSDEAGRVSNVFKSMMSRDMS